MSEADLARSQRGRAAADQRDHRAGVVRRPERRGGHQSRHAASPRRPPSGSSSPPARRPDRVPAGRRSSVAPASSCPSPGAPTSSRWWPPAAAISSACRATGWPRTSARSGGGGASSPTGGPGSTGHGVSVVRHVTTSFSVDATRTAPVAATWASGLDAIGTTTTSPSSTATIGATPGTRRSEPSSPSSPTNPCPATDSGGIAREATRTPMAIARSSPAPVLRRPDGARLTVMHADRPGQLAAHDGGPDPVAGFSTRRVRAGPRCDSREGRVRRGPRRSPGGRWRRGAWPTGWMRARCPPRTRRFEWGGQVALEGGQHDSEGVSRRDRPMRIPRGSPAPR